MGLFNFLKSESTGQSKTFWNDLTTDISLDEIDEISKTKPVLLFKHSTRCSVSLMAKNGLDRSWDLSEEEIATYYLDLLRYRPISNEIASRYNVMHESPQILLIKNGKCVYNTSHSNISVREIKRNL